MQITPEPVSELPEFDHGGSRISVLCDPQLDPLFWRPDRLGAVSAWWGHVPFAFWLVAELRPQVIVELGTYTGASYSAFCQAVENCQLACACFAVDTWEGDDQIGRYSDQVFLEFKKFHDDHYSAFSALLRERFDSAVEKFKDGSIDILHIDGFHQYEAVRLDFNTWLPKLSDRGVVLFHDSNERIRDFGVWRLIGELRERFPVFEFLHGHGLALVSVGKQAPQLVKELCSLTPSEIATLRDRFTFAGSRWESLALQARYSEEAEASAARLAALQTSYSKEAEASAAHLAALQASYSKEAEVSAARLAAQQANIDSADAAANALREQLVHARNADSAAREEFAMELARQKSALQAESVRLRALDAEAHRAAYKRIALAYGNESARSEELQRAHEIQSLENRGLTTKLQSAERSISDLTEQLSQIRCSQSWALMSRLQWPAGKLPGLQSFGRRIVKSLSQNREAKRQAQVLRACGLFDEAWYIQHYPDVAAAGIEPLAHYLANGSNEGRLPNPLFDTAWYRLSNADVLAAANLDPLNHYFLVGSAEARRPTPLFDPQWYRAQYPDVVSSGMEALTHYLLHGSKERRRPSALFDPEWYLTQYPDVAAAGIDPLRHYIHHGSAENRMPNPLFKPDWYRAQYPDVAETGQEPLGHYVAWGAGEGRRPIPSFDPLRYLASYPDVQSSGMDAFAHYLMFGKLERREPAGDGKA